MVAAHFDVCCPIEAFIVRFDECVRYDIVPPPQDKPDGLNEHENPHGLALRKHPDDGLGFQERATLSACSTQWSRFAGRGKRARSDVQCWDSKIQKQREARWKAAPCAR